MRLPLETDARNSQYEQVQALGGPDESNDRELEH